MVSASNPNAWSQITEYCFSSQGTFCEKFHLKEGGARECSAAPLKSGGWTNCEGEKSYSQGYWEQSPLENSLDRWGAVPVVGALSGLGRIVCGMSVCSFGVLGIVANVVKDIVILFFRIDISHDWLNESFQSYERGAGHLWIGLKRKFHNRFSGN